MTVTKSKTLQSVSGAIFLTALAGVAHGSPLTYNWLSGSATVSATNGNNGNSLLAAGATIPITAPSQVTFDSTALDVPSFEFTDQGTTNLPLQGSLSGDTLEVTDLTVMPGSGYTSSASGINPYTISLDDVKASGSFEVVNAANTIIAGPTSFSQLNPTLSGEITLSGSEMTGLTLTGVTLGLVSIGKTPVTIKGDIEFGGMSTVPVPAAVWLLTSGLIVLSGMAVTRRRDINQPGTETQLCVA